MEELAMELKNRYTVSMENHNMQQGGRISDDAVFSAVTFGPAGQNFSDPAARDVRKLLAALKMIFDLERIGDHAANVAEGVEYSIAGSHLTAR